MHEKVHGCLLRDNVLVEARAAVNVFAGDLINTRLNLSLITRLIFPCSVNTLLMLTGKDNVHRYQRKYLGWVKGLEPLTSLVTT